MTWTTKGNTQYLTANDRYRISAWKVRGEWRFRGYVAGDWSRKVSLMEVVWTPDAAEARAEIEKQWEMDNDTV